MLVREITACRACRDVKLDPVLDLGNLAVSDFLAPGQALDRAPLRLVRCAGCGLVQLKDTVDRDRLYRTYHYRSGVNEMMVAALADVVADATRRVDLRPGDTVLDIGANDGTLLAQYDPMGGALHRIGFDPSDVARDAWLDRRFAYDLVRDYFPTRRQHTPTPCKIVTAVACFYDLDDPGAFLDEVKRWLHPDGVLVLQFQDAASMVDANAVDNVCHEHLCYYDLAAIGRLADDHGLYVAAESHHPINGGSLRVVLKHGTSTRFWGCCGDLEPDADWRAFAQRVQANKRDTATLLRALVGAGKSVYGIAASTKFNTLAQFYGIGPDLITAIGERSPHKWGKTTVTGIPIVSEDEMRAAQPDYLFTGAWQFADAFAERERDLLARGTKLIVPLPALRVVEGRRADAPVLARPA